MKIRVLVVEDNPIVRKAIELTLNAEGDFEVVGVAADGDEGLAAIKSLNPDLVVLDHDMPTMSGITMLRMLRDSNAELPVIMFSALTERGAALTLDALLAGANDYVSKGEPGEGIRRIRSELVPKARAIVSRDSGPELKATIDRKPDGVEIPPGQAAHALIGMGTSTGGPGALLAVLSALGRVPIPVLIVQHMPRVFTRQLANRLSAETGLPIREARDGEVIAEGFILLAPGGKHMSVEAAEGPLSVKIDDGPEVHGCRPSIDVLFKSIARACGSQSIAVVLTGIGEDGVEGAAAIAEAGGHVIVQDRNSSVAWEPAEQVIHRGVAGDIVSLGEIGPLLRRYANVHASSPTLR